MTERPTNLESSIDPEFRRLILRNISSTMKETNQIREKKVELELGKMTERRINHTVKKIAGMR